MTKRRRGEQHVDRMSEESFPASDPPSTSPPEGSRRAERHEGRADSGGRADTGVAGEAAPKGQPHHDRYQQETAAAHRRGVQPPERDGHDKE